MKASSPFSPSRNRCLIRAALVAVGMLFGGLFSAAIAAEPTEFSTAYLDGKAFFAVAYEGTRPLSAYSLAFTASTFDYEDVLPSGGTDSGVYAIDNGEIAIGADLRIRLLSSTPEYLRVEIAETGAPPMTSHWFFTEGDAEAALATSPLLPNAWINVDGDFDDWSDVPAISPGDGSSGVIEIVSVQSATDAQFLFFAIETDIDLTEYVPSTDDEGRDRILLVSFNGGTEFGTKDGVSGWFYDGGSVIDFRSVGGDFRIDGPRLEGKVPLALIVGTQPGYLHLLVELFASDGIGNDDAFEGLFRVESGWPEGGVEFFGLGKFAYYDQTSSAVPQLANEEAFEAEVFLEASTPHSVAGATLTFPDQSPHPLARDDEGDTWWGAASPFADQIALDAAFPNGTYTLTIDLASGEAKAASLPITGDAYPQAPRIVNYEAAQAINSAETFTFTWDAFPGAGPDDFIIVGIEDPPGDELIYESDFLPSTTTSFAIPGGILQPGQTYRAWILFANVVATDTDAFSEVSGLGMYGSETRLEIQTGVETLAAGEWRFGEFGLSEYPQTFGTTYDVVFEDDNWYWIEGPHAVQVSEQGVISGAVSLSTQVGNHGQLFFFNPALPEFPEGHAILNRSEDVFISPWGWDVTVAVKSPEGAQQSDFAGAWNFTALTAGTLLTKTVYDQNLASETTVIGHNAPIAQDGSQHLVDVVRTATSADSMSLNVDASGNAGTESLLWQADGSLAFSPVSFPLLPNASRDFVFGIGETGDEQTLILGVRAPTNADSSWLVGQWRFTRIAVDALGREYFNSDTGQTRTVHGNDDQRQSLAGERLTGAAIDAGVNGHLVTFSPALAAELGISPAGVINDEGALIFLNASGDILVTAAEFDNGWELEMGFKVSDVINPVRTLNANVSGPGSIGAYPGEVVDQVNAFTADYIHGETVVIRQEAWDRSFIGWSGDVPADQKNAEVLIVPMDRDRWITAHFGDVPNPWNPEVDSDGDGMPDVVEALFGMRDPQTPDNGGNLLEFQNTPGGVALSFIIRDDYGWPWRMLYSLDLNSWSELPSEVDQVSVPVSQEPPLTRITITWPAQEKKVFFRVEVGDPSAN